jgi:aminoglycoside phosphotransferase (APT) family kinase protein
MQMLWAGFRDRYAGRASAAHLKIGDAITSRYDQFKSGYRGPRCLVHNDYRPDNMMFGTPEGGYPVTVVDWQSLGYGSCMADVSYFLAGALSQTERKTHERELLQRYHAGLVSLGVNDYSFDQLWRDYGRFSFSLFIMGFSASMVVEQTSRGDDMFFQMLDTSAAHILEHNAIAILDQE